MTRDDLTSLVLDRLSVSSSETDKVALVHLLLNQEYVRLVAEEKLAIERADLIYTADDPLVDLPDDFSQIVKITVGGAPIRPISREDLAQYEGSVFDSEIAAYTFEAPNRIRLPWAPEADDAAGAVLTYVPRPTLLATGSDEPSVIPYEYHDILAERVIVRMGAAEEEPFLANSAQQLADDILRRMRAFLGRRSGGLGPTIRVRGVQSV